MNLSSRRTAGEFGCTLDFAWATLARVSCSMEAVLFVGVQGLSESSFFKERF
jgi:hypothetical protein